MCPCLNPPFNSLYFTHSCTRWSVSWPLWPSFPPLFSSRHPLSLIPHPCLHLLPPHLSSQPFSVSFSPFLMGVRSPLPLYLLACDMTPLPALTRLLQPRCEKRTQPDKKCVKVTITTYKLQGWVTAHITISAPKTVYHLFIRLICPINVSCNVSLERSLAGISSLWCTLFSHN